MRTCTTRDWEVQNNFFKVNKTMVNKTMVNFISSAINTYNIINISEHFTLLEN